MPDPARPTQEEAPARLNGGHRYLLFSNEMIGLGHLRRTLAITARLAQVDGDGTSLIMTGSPIQAPFALPPRVEAVTLPTLTRDEHGTHRARRLALELGELEDLRASIALAAAVAFKPNVAVVDRFPLGVDGELERVLEALKASGCKLVLGLRDIEDDPLEVRRRWGRKVREAIQRYYDLILVYGPPSPALDALDCLGWNDVRVPLVHVGYVSYPAARSGPRNLPGGYLLATVGGGCDGFTILATLAEAVRLEPLPCPAVIVTGPLMPHEDVRRLRDLTADLPVTVWKFRPDMERLIAGARAVVCMAGYNTVSELMRARKPALLVPRVRPSKEQLLRARELAGRGLQDVMYPDELTPANMRAALDRLLVRPRPTLSQDHYCGTERTVDLLAALAGGGPAARAAAGVAAAGS